MLIAFLVSFLLSSFIGFILSIKIVIEEIINPLYMRTKDEWSVWVCVGIIMLWLTALGKLLTLI